MREIWRDSNQPLSIVETTKTYFYDFGKFVVSLSFRFSYYCYESSDYTRNHNTGAASKGVLPAEVENFCVTSR